MKLIALLLAPALTLAQTTFEVASLKPSTPASSRNSDGGPGSSNPTRYLFHQATLLDLIATAYHIDYFQVASKLPIDSQRFDLDAKLPSGATKEQFRVMLQNLLAERFHLKAHIEQRLFPGYEIVVAKGGPKLKESGANPPAPPTPDYPELTPGRPGLASRHTTVGGNVLVRLIGYRQTLAKFATGISVPGDRPVVDGTGLTGLYDFILEYAYPTVRETSEPAALPDLITAMQRQLGLQLVARKLPFDVVVVDAADKVPTDN